MDEKETRDEMPPSRPSADMEKTPSEDADTEKTYPPKKVVLPTMLALFLVFFLVALDRTIIGTAIPTISAEFDSFGDIAWYEFAFLLPLCVFQLSFGLVFKYYSTKWVLFILTAIFEIGSIVCAAAPNSNALIVGRAITGIGGAGIGSGVFIYITLLFPLEERPKYLGSLGSAFEKATVPPRILFQRTTFFACLNALAIGSVLVIYAFYLPVWIQVVKGKSPQDSSLALIPLLLSNVFCVILGGVLVSKIGYYTPFAIAGCAVLIVGSALISTWTADVSKAKWIGYQIITGAGMGLTLQQPAIAIETVLSESDSPIGLSILNFVMFLGGTVFVTVSQTLLEGQLESKIAKYVPGVDINTLTNSGATNVWNLVPSDKVDLVLNAYNDSMRSIWYLGLGMGCFGLITSSGFEWKNVKAKKTPGVAASA
ncbi:hypothetical protein H9Q70_012486 [Fusarium xylarioides]|nr:hypothetical protein H9Q70_012486 [Fusarium xylarioides]